jgi:Mg2+-importing ATPase
MDPAGAEPLAASSERPSRGRWWIGIVVLAGVVGVVTHLSEGRELVALAERAEPSWLLAALGLQALTYLCAAAVWHRGLARVGARRPLRTLIPLGVAKLFTDQALPSAGLSGSLLVLRGLTQRGVARPAAVGALVIGVFAYFAANAAAALLALAALAVHGEAGTLTWIVAAAACAVSTLVPAIILALRSDALSGLSEWLRRLPRAREVLAALAESPREPILRSWTGAQAAALQLAIIALDAATLAACVHAVGAAVEPQIAFAAFVIASAVASLAWVPGGIGTFEGSCVALLHVHGVSLEAALAGTLLLRGLTFWLPMLPGSWLAQRETRATGGDGSVEAAPGPLANYWSVAPEAVMAALDARDTGLHGGEARERLSRFGRNALRAERGGGALALLLRQFRSPLVAILLFAAAIAALVGEWTDAALVFAILLVTGVLGFAQEHRAAIAIERLRSRVRTRARVLRDDAWVAIPAEEIVPGDVVALAAGSLVPADGVLLEARDLYVSQAALTGESAPVTKAPGIAARGASLAERANCVFMGTSVRSGTATALIVATAQHTVFGAVAQRLQLRPPETEFERGIRHYGYLLTQVMIALVLIVFAANVFLERPAVEALLFALALAVGMSPELLPAIIDVTLARGAHAMAARGVIVRRLDAIENFGSMDVLCTDKTGTLTEGVLALEGAWDPTGARGGDALRDAVLNARFQTGIASPLDDAIVRHADAEGLHPDAQKLDEIPYDFVRKRLSVVVRDAGRPRLLMKGAVANVLDCCDRVRESGGEAPLDGERRRALEARFERWSEDGLRVLAVAVGEPPERSRYTQADEQGLCLVGFLAFSDPPRADARETLAALGALGVRVKIITGDNRYVAAHLARAVGIAASRVITGRELNELRDEALWRTAPEVDLFAEVDPNQKERIILALKKTRHVVGFLGDGINDAPALHAADVGISVDEAVDVAKEAADFVLMKRGLGVLREAVEVGRRSFANTLKYVEITTSANFGNMLSMALASFFLPFLPLLAHQILLNNLLSDVPAMGIASDSVDPEQLAAARRFDLPELRRFMVAFGLISTVFDLIAFGAFWLVTRGDARTFRSAWFVESLLTEVLVMLVIRTRRPCWRSVPGRALWTASLGVIALALALPYLPGAFALGFTPLPPALFVLVCGISLAYAAASELGKRRFFARQPRLVAA